MKERTELKNLPNKLWLNIGEIEPDFNNDFKELRESNEVTWCEDKIDEWDIEYTRTSLIDAEVERRIAERMPTEEEVMQRALHSITYASYYHAVIDTVRWFRSRMKGGEK